MKSALVLFAHGARDPDWSVPFRHIQHKIAARCPDITVELAFLELTPPPLGAILEQLAAGGHERIIIAPLFMAPGGHVKCDVPQLLESLRAHHPGIALHLLPPIGEVDAVTNAITDWLAASVRRQPT